MNITSYNRYQAFAVHLAVSFFIFLILLLLVFYVWYPGIFFESEKGWKAIALIAGVDLVLGPLCTLIVFNPAKKSLKMDLAVIALLQAGALIAGSYLIHERRPVGFLVFNPENGAITLYASNIDKSTLSYIAEQNTPLFYYQTAYDRPVTGSVNASDFSISKDNLLPFSNEILRDKTYSDRPSVFLKLDAGVKDTTYILIDKDKNLEITHLSPQDGQATTEH